MRTSYYYTVNEKVLPQSQKAVNDTIRKMKVKPEVIKIENFSNGRVCRKNIEVKGQPGNLTIK
jgi:hypothetical protein